MMNQFFSIIILLVYSVNSFATEEEVSQLLLSEIMFYRMQDNNFDAIGRYLNAQSNKELVLNENNNAYIASVYLSYDLHSQVSDMMNLLIHNESNEIRDMSWFYLGKLHYRNKRVKSAVKAFSKIKGKLTATEQETKYIMYGVMAMNDHKYDIAIKEFSKVSNKSVLFPYVEFNLAIANVKTDKNLSQLAVTLTALAKKYATGTDESYVFSDRVYTTLGFSLLQNKEYELAKQSFRKVTFNGYLATRALQGMIYASSELQQYETALNLSLQLIKKTVGNESVHHAYIVIPYLLQRLNNTPKAMAFYQHAVGYFSQQRIDIKRYVNKVKRGEFDDYLLDLEKILNVEEWVRNQEMSRLFRFVSTLDEWRDAVYKYREMKYLEKRLDESFYEMVVIEADVQERNQEAYKKSFEEIAANKKQVKKSILWHQKYARRFVVKALQNQYGDVTDYLAQARFALAQFYDLEEQKKKALENKRLREEFKKRQALNKVDNKSLDTSSNIDTKQPSDVSKKEKP